MNSEKWNTLLSLTIKFAVDETDRIVDERRGIKRTDGGRKIACEGFLKEIREMIEDKEMVICAAVRTLEGRIIRGHRHTDCFNTIKDLNLIYSNIPEDQGYLTSKNRYVVREEGERIFKENGSVSIFIDLLSKPKRSLISRIIGFIRHGK